MDEAEDWDHVILNKISTGALKQFVKLGIFWILFDHIQSSSLNAGFGIGNQGETFSSQDDNFVTSTLMKRRGPPDCEHRTKNGLKLEYTFQPVFLKDGERHVWEEKVKYILPVKQCDCVNKEEEDEVLAMTTLNKVYRSSINISGFSKQPLLSMFDPKMEMGHQIFGPQTEIYCFKPKKMADLSHEILQK